MNGFSELFTTSGICYYEISCEVKLEYPDGTGVTN